MQNQIIKKIAIISNTSWYLYNFRSNLIKSLIAKGYEVISIAPFDEYSVRLEELGCKYYQINIDSKSKNPLTDIGITLNFIKIFHKLKPNILLNYTAKPNIYATVVGYYLGISSINNIAGLGSGFVAESLTTKILRVLYRFSQKKASSVFFQNQDDFSEFVNNKMVDPNKCSILPGSGVDLIRFEATPVPTIQNNKFVFLLISRMLYSKGIELLYSAAKKIYENGNLNISIQLLGEVGINNSDAIPASHIQQWVKEPFIEYLGMTDDVRPFVEKSHCIILPSFYREGTPRSILEGLAMGRPIITTDMPGCRTTVIDGENGYIVPSQDVDSLEEKMKQIMKLDYSDLTRMGVRSRQLAEDKFDEKIVIQKYIEAIKKNI
jgi:glycosyltransferase involved in cell wall biosynthesis